MLALFDGDTFSDGTVLCMSIRPQFRVYVHDPKTGQSRPLAKSHREAIYTNKPFSLQLDIDGIAKKNVRLRELTTAGAIIDAIRKFCYTPLTKAEIARARAFGRLPGELNKRFESWNDVKDVKVRHLMGDHIFFEGVRPSGKIRWAS